MKSNIFEGSDSGVPLSESRKMTSASAVPSSSDIAVRKYIWNNQKLYFQLHKAIKFLTLWKKSPEGNFPEMLSKETRKQFALYLFIMGLRYYILIIIAVLDFKKRKKLILKHAKWYSLKRKMDLN